MSAGIVLQQMIVIVLVILIGIICQKAGKIGEDKQKFLSWMVVNVFNPALNVSSILSNQDSRDPRTVLQVFLIGGVMFLIMILLGIVLSLRRKDYYQRRICRMLYVFSNLGFIGIPVVRGVLGEQYIVYVAVFMLEYSILFYSYGQFVMREPSDHTFSLASLKPMLNIGTIAALLSLVLFFSGVSLPYVISRSIAYVGDVATPMALMITGMTLASQNDIKRIFLDKKLYGFFILKMLIIPIAACFLIRQLPVREEIRMLTLIIVSMPNGTLPLMALNERGWPSEECSRLIILTTILSVLTLPLVVFVYGML